jgi:hypothetical protein
MYNADDICFFNFIFFHFFLSYLYLFRTSNPECSLKVCHNAWCIIPVLCWTLSTVWGSLYLTYKTFWNWLYSRLQAIGCNYTDTFTTFFAQYACNEDIWPCLYVCTIQLKNCWMDKDKIWYECYATGGCPKIKLFCFLQSVVPKWWMQKLVKWDQHQRHLLYSAW